ncbi:MAG: hypothetical protein V4772_26710 [Pseudomonadota bacterium]
MNMSLFNWFSGKSGPTKLDADDSEASLRDAPSRSAPAQPQRFAQDPTNRSEERKLKRHARREQLYVAVRDSMTHAGVLSASYKFKVLSLDQRGDQFLVMMDVDQSIDNHANKLAEIETRIIQTARARFEIMVTSVYWRINVHGLQAPARPRAAAPAPSQSHEQAHHAPVHPVAARAAEPLQVVAKKPPASRYEPIQDDEVAAFKHALAAASAGSVVSTDASGKIHSGPRSYTLLTGFEDTEMPESSAAPALSTTQYGDLN